MAPILPNFFLYEVRAEVEETVLQLRQCVLCEVRAGAEETVEHTTCNAL